MARFAVAVVLLASVAGVSAVLCPNGHSDCSAGEYCANVASVGRECWPCTFCSFFSDSVTGNCDVCAATTPANQPASTAAPGAVTTAQTADVGESVPVPTVPVTTPGVATDPPGESDVTASTADILSTQDGTGEAPVTTPPPATTQSSSTADSGEAPLPTGVSTAGPVTTTPDNGEAPVVTGAASTAGPVTTTPDNGEAPVVTGAASTAGTTVGPVGTTHTVSWGFDVSQASITINVLDTVTWVWDQSGFHNVVSGLRGASDAGSQFQSPLQSSGSFSHIFTAPGVFPYHCQPHSSMNAVITVVAAGVTTPSADTGEAPVVTASTVTTPAADTGEAPVVTASTVTTPAADTGEAPVVTGAASTVAPATTTPPGEAPLVTGASTAAPATSTETAGEAPLSTLPGVTTDTAGEAPLPTTDSTAAPGSTTLPSGEAPVSTSAATTLDLGEAASVTTGAQPTTTVDPIGEVPVETTAAATTTLDLGESPLTTTAAAATTTLDPGEAAGVSTTAGTTTAPLVCQANCGQAENGGGTCRVRPSDNATVCSSCNSDKLLWRGRCNLRLNCLARTITSGRLAGQSCRCLDRDNCHSCVRNATHDVCRQCRNGMFLRDDDPPACHSTCPSTQTMAGINLFGRRCLDPFVCKSGAIGQLDQDGNFVRGTYPFGCRCPAPGNRPYNGCFICDFRAGERGERCLRCGSSKFLYNESCHDSCEVAGAPSNYVPYAPGSYRRECVPEGAVPGHYRCTNNVGEHGDYCRCSFAAGRVNGRRCNDCNYNATGVYCLE